MTMRNKVFALVFFSVLCLSSNPTAATNSRELKVGYYELTKTCPNAENIVRSVVDIALRLQPGIGAGLIRLFFHDCFVNGCDGSVLLDPTPKNPKPEKLAEANIGLRGFGIIDAAKALLEISCPGVVSCADTLAFAARDASEILNGFPINMTSGRLDGKISNATLANENLPPPTFDLDQLKELFVTKKGLSVEDLVVLSGAHTIGRSHCSSFTNRLYPNIDPTLDEDFAINVLRKQCPQNSSVDNLVNLDYKTPLILDSQYYKNVKDGKVTFSSDMSLLTSNETKDLVEEYATVALDWENDFTESMVHLGNVDVITDPSKGEIRKLCRFVNIFSEVDVL